MSARLRVLLGLLSVIAIGAAVTYAARESQPKIGVVPAVVSDDVSDTFGRLRDRGFRVAISDRTHFYATTSPRVVLQTPHSGTRLAWGSVVTLGIAVGPIGSPAGPDKLPKYRVPDFVGKRLAEAVDWTRGKFVYWEADLPPLPPSSAKHLYDAYVVTSQHPVAGSDMRLWNRIPNGVRLTPLVLDVAVARRSWGYG